jgi:DNA ligase-associated metallophosphoesterase
MEIAGVSLWPTACGALWRPDLRTLIVSDLHFEKGSFYAARGEMLPPYDTRATLRRLARLVQFLHPECVVALGDSFHDGEALLRMTEEDAVELRSLTGTCDWIWILGNHDRAPPSGAGGRALEVFGQDGLTFRHEPSAAERAYGEVCGHLHPCARVAGRGGKVRTRCFASDSRRIVLPAYGALTGGLNVLDPAFRAVFPEGLVVATLGRAGAYLAPMSQLLPDSR